MKKLLTAALFLFASILSYAQCTPNGATGTPGITPSPDSVACIERGVPYSATMQFENFTTVGGFATMTSATIDSLVNFPCGIEWSANKLTFGPGETGCIDVFGTTTDSAGQYPLKIYMTITVGLFGMPFTQSGEITQLITAAGPFLGGTSINVSYYSRVIEPGDSCLAIDTSASATNLTSACLKVAITGDTLVCVNAPTTYTATTYNVNGTPSFEWSNGDTTATITVTPSAMTSYAVTVTDQVGSATASTTVDVDPFPIASFTATNDSDAVVSFANLSVNATGYAWDFGDTTTSIVQIPAPHTYTSSGTKTIQLIATNNCGSDTTTEDVTVTVPVDTPGVFINSVSSDLSFDVFPNPSNGNIAVSFSVDNNSKEYELKIFDLSGKNVFEEKITATGSVQRQLDLSTLPKGVYTLHLSSGSGFGVKKLQLN